MVLPVALEAVVAVAAFGMLAAGVAEHRATGVATNPIAR